MPSQYLTVGPIYVRKPCIVPSVEDLVHFSKKIRRCPLDRVPASTHQCLVSWKVLFFSHTDVKQHASARRICRSHALHEQGIEAPAQRLPWSNKVHICMVRHTLDVNLNSRAGTQEIYLLLGLTENPPQSGRRCYANEFEAGYLDPTRSDTLLVDEKALETFTLPTGWLLHP